MLDWFYDTPIGQEVAKMNQKEITIGNINEYRKKIKAKRLKGKLKRKRKSKSKNKLKINYK